MTPQRHNAKLIGALWRLTAFATVCVLGGFALVAVFGQLRFDDTVTYRAEFTNVSGLEAGNFVRIAGVEVGKVRRMSIEPDTTVLVDFDIETDVALTDTTEAVVRYENLIGGRYLELQQGLAGEHRLHPGDTIDRARTAPALDLDALIGGFRPLFRALDPDQVNDLSQQLVDVFQGQGPTIESFLSSTASLTGALADRDQIFGELITNLNIVLGSLAEHDRQFDTAVESLTRLVDGLAQRRTEISTGLAYTDAAAATVADLLAAARPPLQTVVAQADRTAGLVMSDAEYVDHLLATLPDAYRVLSRQGLYGDYFSFYLCDLLFKVNGKGGQPVYVKVAGQSTGRCAPK
ncbi:MCE family protein [Mycobacterium manitobense]|uniref:MCE family protein n=1 Tax=[Mycobacterium] manitobense TaxID=190147 RepID=A0A9X3BUL1_9MYCO|nr:MCE family protein [[Mycobacterium] manitobense]MCV7169591.1 MCE family protein [[Mycobacterium] manitobense]